MADYRVALATSASRELARLPPALVVRLVARLERLAIHPRPPGCKKLRGGDKEWRIPLATTGSCTKWMIASAAST